MPIALLAGAFGQGNLGDEALLEAFVKALPEWQLRVTTADPAAAGQMGCEPVPARPLTVARAAHRADAVLVGVRVAVTVWVLLGVRVAVLVGVRVAVPVIVAVSVTVGDKVAVGLIGT